MLLFTRIYMLLIGIWRTKLDFLTTCTVEHHINVQADENFRTKIHESKNVQTGQKMHKTRQKRIPKIKIVFISYSLVSSARWSFDQKGELKATTIT